MYKSYYTNCFLNSKYYQEIKNNYKVLFTFLGGSHLLHCETASSDYDITIVVADDFEFSSITTSYLRFNDKIGYIDITEKDESKISAEPGGELCVLSSAP